MTDKNEPKLGDEIPKQELKEAEKEINSKFKAVIMDFRGEKDAVLHIYQPTTKDDSLSFNEHAKVFNQMIKDEDMMTRKEMEDILEKRGIWGKKETDRLDEVQTKMRDLEFVVAKMKQSGKINKKKMKELRTQWFIWKGEISDLFTKKTEYLTNTIESRAEEAEVKAKLSLCVKFPDGERVWNSLDELEEEEDRTAVVALVNKAMFFWTGLTQEIIDDLPAKLLFGGEEKSEN